MLFENVYASIDQCDCRIDWHYSLHVITIQKRALSITSFTLRLFLAVVSFTIFIHAHCRPLYTDTGAPHL